MPDLGSAADRLAAVVLLTEWRKQLDAGYLTWEGLLAVRRRLMIAGEFAADMPMLLLLRADIDKAVAAKIGCEPGEVPGSILAVPDSPEEIIRREW